MCVPMGSPRDTRASTEVFRVGRGIFEAQNPIPMRLFALWLLHCLSSAVAIGQSYTPPLDPLPKESLPGVGYWQNGGQVADLADNPMNEVRFYSDGVVPRTCFMDGGQLGLVREVLSPDTINPDTLYRVDMIPVDAAPVEPIGIEASLEYMNFYLGHTMPNGVEYMHRYRYVVYPDLWPGITMWVYADGHKQRIAFACAPGSDPSVIRFKYVGQEEALLDPDGNAILNVNVGDLMMPAPMIYKVVGNNAVDLPEEAPATMEEVTDVAGQDAVEYEVPVVEADPYETHRIALQRRSTRGGTRWRSQWHVLEHLLRWQSARLCDRECQGLEEQLLRHGLDTIESDSVSCRSRWSERLSERVLLWYLEPIRRRGVPDMDCHAWRRWEQFDLSYGDRGS